MIQDTSTHHKARFCTEMETKSRGLCKFFGTSNGCRNGDHCPYAHIATKASLACACAGQGCKQCSKCVSCGEGSNGLPYCRSCHRAYKEKKERLSVKPERLCETCQKSLNETHGDMCHECDKASTVNLITIQILLKTAQEQAGVSRNELYDPEKPFYVKRSSACL